MKTTTPPKRANAPSPPRLTLDSHSPEAAVYRQASRLFFEIVRLNGETSDNLDDALENLQHRRNGTLNRGGLLVPEDIRGKVGLLVRSVYALPKTCMSPDRSGDAVESLQRISFSFRSNVIYTSVDELRKAMGYLVAVIGSLAKEKKELGGIPATCKEQQLPFGLDVDLENRIVSRIDLDRLQIDDVRYQG